MKHELRVDADTLNQYEHAVCLHEEARQRVAAAVRKERAARSEKGKREAQSAVAQALEDLEYRVDNLQQATLNLACACYWRGYGEGSGIASDPLLGPHQAKVLAAADTLSGLAEKLRADISARERTENHE